MILQKIIVTRPSTDVQWHWLAMDRKEYVQHLTKEYVATGKLLANYAEYSRDGLTSTWFCYWDSKETFDQTLVDPIFQRYWDARSQYISEHGITMTEELVEIN